MTRAILKAVDRAYSTMTQRNWDTIYWAIDLHGVCLESNYEQGGYCWLNNDTINGLRAISKRPESKIILWSSVYDQEKANIIEFFSSHGIQVYAFNSNTERNTRVSCFDEKFYFSVLLDDKAGFDPDKDWAAIYHYFKLKDLSDE